MHQDHRTVAELTWNTFRNHLVLEYEIRNTRAISALRICSSRSPARSAERKVELLLKHFPSQAARTVVGVPTRSTASMSVRAVECNAPRHAREAFPSAQDACSEKEP
jgi:LmbE family N-acetylglucosaminyl deacetylase